MFWGFVIGAVAVLVVVGAVLGAVLSSSGSSSGSGAYTWKVNFAQLPNLHQGPPPWDSGTDFLDSRLPFLHLKALPNETLAFHIHAHLDLYVKGKKVTLPAGVGFLPDGELTSLHTHAPDGIIHIESPVNRQYSLGQVFGEWGVWLSARRIGDDRGKVRWWVDGKPMTGNPADLLLKAHQEIAIAIGPPPLIVPKSYKFPPGD
jgi:hypothetical protein